MLARDWAAVYDVLDPPSQEAEVTSLCRDAADKIVAMLMRVAPVAPPQTVAIQEVLARHGLDIDIARRAVAAHESEDFNRGALGAIEDTAAAWGATIKKPRALYVELMRIRGAALRNADHPPEDFAIVEAGDRATVTVRTKRKEERMALRRLAGRWYVSREQSLVDELSELGL